MPDKDNTITNTNSNKRKIQTSNQSSKHRKKQEGTAIAIPSRDAPQRERPFTDPRRVFPNTNANKTIKRRSDIDSDFMEDRVNKILTKAAASNRINRPRESESISFDLPSSSSSDIKPSKFASTKQPTSTPKTVDPAKLLEIIRSQRLESEASRSNVIHKHKVFGNVDLPTNRVRLNPREIDNEEDNEDEVFDKTRSPGSSSSSYSSSNKAKSTEVIEIDLDEETNPSSITTTEKKNSPFDFLNAGASNAKTTIVAGLPKVALGVPKPKSYMEYMNRSNDLAKNKGLSTSMSSYKPKITSPLRGASESSGNTSSSIKSDRAQRDAASSLQSDRQSNSDITSRKYTEVNTPFTTQLRSKRLGSTTSTTPLCYIPPVKIPVPLKTISTSSVSSSGRLSFIPPLSYRKKSNTSISSSSTYKSDNYFASSPLNRIGNSNSTSKLANRSSVLTSPNIKNIKQQQENHVIIVSDSSSDDDSASEDEFHTAPSSPVEKDSSYDEDVTDMDEVVNNLKER